MAKAVGGLWRAVERKTGWQIPESVREFIQLRGWVDDWLKEEGKEGKAACVETIVEVIEHLMESGLLKAGIEEHIGTSLKEDGRWDLIRDLKGDPDYQPIRVRRAPANRKMTLKSTALNASS